MDRAHFRTHPDRYIQDKLIVKINSEAKPSISNTSVEKFPNGQKPTSQAESLRDLLEGKVMQLSLHKKMSHKHHLFTESKTLTTLLQLPE